MSEEIRERDLACLTARFTFAVALLACAACETAGEENVVAAAVAASATPPAPAAPVAPTPVVSPQANLSPEAVKSGDDFLWLEEVNGERALKWVREENKKTAAILEKDPRYEAFRKEALAILTAQDRIPTPNFRGDAINNFWQDQKSVRGVWRRATLESYREDKPKWQTVLDIDALAKSEKKNWIYKGADCLAPEEKLCLVSLSDGGKDAVVVREYDTAEKRFVRNGFKLPEGKHRLAWLNQDTLLVATDFGEGSLTESGYPFIVKTLARGEELATAKTLYSGAAKDGGYGVDPYVLRDGAGKVLAVLVSRPLDTFRSETWEIVEGKPVKLALPERVTIRGALGGGSADAAPRLVFTVEEPWAPNNIKKVGAGALMAVGMRLLRPPPPGVGLVMTNADTSVFEPTARQSLEEVAVFDDRLVASVYDNVRGRVSVFSDKDETAGWVETALPAPANSAIHLGSASRQTGRIFYTHEGFLTPSTLSLANANSITAEVLRQSPERFDASRHVVEQFEATSSDGTKVPYFVVRLKDAPLDGSTPTLMFGYGGFQVSYPPAYKPELGKLWLERGGAYVLANIRGGGEFGPAWHQAALKANRQRAFDDFAAVAADLAHRKITSAEHLGIYGRSNGGVLTSVTLTQHPELIGGAVIESPLVDMLRYHELPPGASWIGEYGDPRIAAEAGFIAKYSAYQNIREGAKYPEVYITTNTRDDRVHPGHARKFAAKLQKMGFPALYYENTDGGHSNDSDPVLNSKRWALHYVYLARQLGPGGAPE